VIRFPSNIPLECPFYISGIRGGFREKQESILIRSALPPGLGWTYPCDIWSVGCILVELCSVCDMGTTTELPAISFTFFALQFSLPLVLVLNSFDLLQSCYSEHYPVNTSLLRLCMENMKLR
jgi:hypothetical protein